MHEIQGKRVNFMVNNDFIEVKSKNNAILARIKFFDRWNTYIFYPEIDKFFNSDTLREILEYIESLNERNIINRFRYMEKDHNAAPTN